MSDDRRLSDEMRNAFVDGQLDGAEAAEILARMRADGRVRDEVCRARLVKDLVRTAYADVEPPPARRRAVARPRTAALAALVLACAFAGWQARGWLAGSGGDAAMAPAVLAAASTAKAPGAIARVLVGDGALDSARLSAADRVLVHVSSDRQGELAKALDGVEALLRAAREAGRPISVEIVANGAGIDLLRADASPFVARLAALRGDHPGLALTACNQALDRLRERGLAPKLLPGVGVATSALDRVVERLEAGWLYVRT